MPQDLTIVIPAYNEEQSLQDFLPQVIQHCETKGYKLIVVNDGSRDKTLEVLKCFSAKSTALAYVSHKVNRGYGGAIKSGVRAAQTEYVITIDADGQHYLEDVDLLFGLITERDADMVIGNRGLHSSSYYRTAGKWLIRRIARILIPMKIQDINSGIKIYNTELAKKYIKVCPDTMAYSDVIGLFFVNQRHLVLGAIVRIRPRSSGKSTISTRTAFETVKEILNIVVLFNPMRIFFPLSMFFLFAGIVWAIPILLMGRGLSVGALLGITTGTIFFLLGLIAEQLSSIIKSQSMRE